MSPHSTGLKFGEHYANSNALEENITSKSSSFLSKNTFRHSPQGKDLKINNVFDAIMQGDTEKTKEFINITENLNIKDSTGNNPLILAIKLGDVDTALALIESGKVDLFYIYSSEKTALHLAIEKNLEPIIQKLKTEMQDKGELIHNNIQLSQALEDNDLDKVIELISKKQIDLNIKNSLGQTALLKATEINNLVLVEEILKRDNINIDAQNNCGETALLKSIESNNLEIVKRLLSKNANPDIINGYGYTPFSLSLSDGKLQILKELLKKMTDDQIFTKIIEHDEHKEQIYKALNSNKFDKAIEEKQKSKIKYLLQEKITPDEDPEQVKNALEILEVNSFTFEEIVAIKEKFKDSPHSKNVETFFREKPLEIGVKKALDSLSIASEQGYFTPFSSFPSFSFNKKKTFRRR